MNATLQRMLVPFAPFFARHQKQVLALRLRKALGRRMQDPPESFHDKLFWMSSNTDTSLWTRLSDKVKVRDYVAQCCEDGVLTELFATYQTADDICFENLPERFVIKTNNSCASNCIVRSKSATDLDSVRLALAGWLRFPYGELTGQMHYARIKPLILAEELLYQDDQPDSLLPDYKFYCFDGDVRYCYVVSDRQFDAVHSHKRMLYDMDWNAHPDVFKPGVPLGYASKPSSFEKMKEVARRLSRGIPFVRVDLYEVGGTVKFGEMTFLPGMHHGYTERFQEQLGEAIVLPPAGRCSPFSTSECEDQ